MPLVLAAATLVKYLADAALAELAANWLPAPLKIVAQWLDAADAEYIIAVSAAALYWANQENLKTAALEFCKMAYENFFQATRRKLLNNALNKGIAIGHDKGRDEGIAIGHDKGRDEGIAIGRDEGIAIGRDEGRDEGRAEASNEIIQQIKDQVPPEIIQQIKDLAGRNGNGSNGSNGNAGKPDDPR